MKAAYGVCIGLMLLGLAMFVIGPPAQANHPYGNSHPNLERILQSMASKPINVQCECVCPK